MMGIQYHGFQGRSAISEQEIDHLSRLLANQARTLIEVGTLDGVSAAVLAVWNPRSFILSVDPFVRGVATGPGDPLRWLANRRQNQALIVGTLRTVADQKLSQPPSFIFIDGDHSEQGCAEDLEQAARIIKPGGAILVHDYGRPESKFHGIDVAVVRFCACSDWRMVKQVGTIAHLERTA